MKFFKKAKRGFTLVELVVVIAVIAILAAVSVGAYFGVTDSANNSKLTQEAKQVHTGIQLVGRSTDKNSSLSASGLYINDLDSFEAKFNEMNGMTYDALAGATDPVTISTNTVYFFNSSNVSGQNIVDTTYNSFAYYTPQVGGKRAVGNIVTGDIKVEEATFEIVPQNAPVELYSLEVSVEEGTDTSYYAGSTLSFNGFSFLAKYTNNTSRNVLIEDVEISTTSIPEDAELGNFPVTFKFVDENGLGEATGTYNFTVKEDIATNLKIVDKTKVNKTPFVGETIDFSKLEYVLIFESGKQIEVNKNDVRISQTVLTDTNSTTITFSYTYNGSVFEDTITGFVAVANQMERIEITGSIPGQYYTNSNVSDLDLSDLTAQAIYNNSKKNHPVSLDELQCTVDFTQKPEKATFVYTDSSIPVNAVDFDESILDVILEEFVVEKATNEEIVYAYQDNLLPNKDNLIFKAHFNYQDNFNKEDDGYYTILNAEDVEIVTEKIELSTTVVEYKYTFGDQTFTKSVNVKVTNFKTFYFEDKAWWHQDDAIPFVQFSTESSTDVPVISETENDMLATLVGGSKVDGISTSPDTNAKGSAVWKFSFDTNKFKTFRIYRIERVEEYVFNSKDEHTDITYLEACTPSIHLQNIPSGSNLIKLANIPTWCEEEKVNNPTKITFGTYDESKPLSYIEAELLVNNKRQTETYVPMVYKDNSFVTEDSVELSLRTEAKIHVSTFDYIVEENHKDNYYSWFGYSNGYNVTSSIENDDPIALKNSITSSGTNDNFYINYGAIGTYKISLDLGGTVNFNKVSESEKYHFDTPYKVVGLGDDWTFENALILTTCDEYTIDFELNLSKNERFKIVYNEANMSVEDSYNHSKTIDFNDLNTDLRKYFVNQNNGDITTWNQGGLFKFRITDIWGNRSLSLISAPMTPEQISHDLYFRPHELWKSDNAWFAVNLMTKNKGTAKWAALIDNNNDGYYECYLPEGDWYYVIFCRMNENKHELSWDSRDNQTADIELNNSKNIYYMENNVDPWTNNWNKSYWRTKSEINSYKKLYLKPNANWKSDGARFAVYFFTKNGGNKWYSMFDFNSDGIYEIEYFNNTHSNLIFVRMKGNTSENNWDNDHNQTNDLSLPTNGNNLYTINEGAWSNGGGSWSTRS